MREIRVETWPLPPIPGLQRFGYRIITDEKRDEPKSIEKHPSAEQDPSPDDQRIEVVSPDGEASRP